MNTSLSVSGAPVVTVPMINAWKGAERCRNCGIRDVVLFSDLQQEDFALIHEPIEEIRFGAGEVMYRADEPAESAFTLREGLVKLVRYLPDGTQRIVRLLTRGDIAGLETVLDRRYEHTAIVLEPVEICRIPAGVLRRLNRETPRLHHQLMARWQKALSSADAWITELSTGPAKQRVARLLIRQAKNCGRDGLHLLGREDIGAMLGITTETASRVVAQFKREGVIREVGRGLYQADLDGLRRQAGE